MFFTLFYMFRDSCVSCLLHVAQIWVFTICYMLYRSKCLLFVTCCTDMGVYCLLYVVQIKVFSVYICCTDLRVWSEASQDIQHSLPQHSRELLVAGV